MVETDKTTLEESVQVILDNYFKPQKYSVFIGRYQPLHEGHIKLINKVLDEGKNVCVALRHTPINKDNPYSIKEREEMIRKAFGDKVKVVIVPDVDDVCHGREVGWGIREIRLDAKTEEISATKIREAIKDNLK